MPATAVAAPAPMLPAQLVDDPRTCLELALVPTRTGYLCATLYCTHPGYGRSVFEMEYGPDRFHPDELTFIPAFMPDELEVFGPDVRRMALASLRSLYRACAAGRISTPFQRVIWRAGEGGAPFARGMRVAPLSTFSRRQVPGIWSLSEPHSNGTCWYVRERVSGRVEVFAITRLRPITDPYA